MAASWQSHAGPAVTSGQNESPHVHYAYEDGADQNGNARFVRLSSVTYPGAGRTVYYNYPTDGVGGRLSRLDNIAARASTDPNFVETDKYAVYTYLGAGTITQVAHPAVSGGLTLTYGAAGNYTGWDRFGRVVDQRWTDTAGTDLDRFTYTYDLASNRLSRTSYSGAEGALGGPRESYTYDGLNRLTAVDRTAMPGDADTDGDVDSDDLGVVYGNYLNSGMTWADGDFDGDGTVGDADVATVEAHFGTSGLAGQGTQEWTLDSLGNWSTFDDQGAVQERQHDAANQITAIDNGWIVPEYDDAGNMISGPKPGDGTTELKFVYDAWNRLVKVTDSSDVAIAEYRYDGQGRRIQRTVDETTDDYYYNEAGQVLEVRRGGEENPLEQYVWDIRYVDAPVVRFYDGDTDGNYLDASDNVLYYVEDANFSVTALVDGASGAVVERYVYDPYGKVSIFTGARDDQGNSTQEWQPRSVTLFDNQILYSGYRRDLVTGLYHTDTREYDAYLGRWLSRDPAGAIDGANLYQYVSGNPVRYTDPLGLCKMPCGLMAGSTAPQALRSGMSDGSYGANAVKTEPAGGRPIVATVLLGFLDKLWEWFQWVADVFVGGSPMAQAGIAARTLNVVAMKEYQDLLFKRMQKRGYNPEIDPEIVRLKDIAGAPLNATEKRTLEKYQKQHGISPAK